MKLDLIKYLVLGGFVFGLAQIGSYSSIAGQQEQQQDTMTEEASEEAAEAAEDAEDEDSAEAYERSDD